MKPTPLDPLRYRLRPEDLEGEFPELLECLSNVPDSPALLPIPIDRAGITKQLVSINLPPLRPGGGERLPVLCEVTASTSLGTSRGVHMSRFEECLFAIAADPELGSIDSFAARLAREIGSRQGSSESHVQVKGMMSVARATPVTGKISHDMVHLLASARVSPAGERAITGIRAHNVTACPCTLTFTKFSVIPSLLAKGFSLPQIQDILDTTLSGTHLQRGAVTLEVEKTSGVVTSAALFGILDRATHLVFDLLKRPDEHELVIRALKRPQFTEDVVRDIAFATLETLGEAVSPSTRIEIRSELQDSIHIHDVFTELKTSVAQLRQALRR